MTRPLIRPFTDVALRESNEAINQAVARGTVIKPRQHVRLDVKCNQPDITLAPCDWFVHIETTGLALQARARGALRDHLMAAHPSMSVRERTRILDAMWYNLRDIGG